MPNIGQYALLDEAKSLKSDGDNLEYDRALYELLYWTFEWYGNLHKKLGVDLKKLYPNVANWCHCANSILDDGSCCAKCFESCLKKAGKNERVQRSTRMG
jgi:hypothetical protein